MRVFIYIELYVQNTVIMKYLTLPILIFLPLLLAAQIDYSIHLSHGPILLSKSLEQQWQAVLKDSSSQYNSNRYLLVQLQTIPNRTEKLQLKESGIELLHYIPHFAWVAKFSNQVRLSDLKIAQVRAISSVKSDWKIPYSMRQGYIPPHAGTVDKLSVKLLFWKDNTDTDYASLCLSLGLDVETYQATWSWVLVNTTWNQLKKIAEHPLVQYLEWPEKATETENLNELTLIQSNYIADNPAQGLYFNGQGVAIAVNESGAFDSTQSANLKGRLDRTFETGNNDGHKTSVGMRMASAGNLDPLSRGTAFGANLHSGGIDFANAASSGISIVNNSFGYGCIGAATTATYNSGAATNDNLVRSNPSFMITYSCGNQGNTDCGYGAGAAGGGWGNITGLTKSAKNIFAVGSLTTSGDLAGFSSKGPAWDGRILPDICAAGPGGTSHASPNLAGVYAQLVQAYQVHNAGQIPNSGLIKAILMNTADDMLNPGPDFKSGYGKINARKAYNCIAQNHFLSGSVGQGGNNAHTLSVPSGVQEIRAMVYWTDYEATAGIPGRALVNDLDFRVLDPSNVQWQPWVLNPTPDSASLELWAVRATDTLNNVEQVTLTNPLAGTYSLLVDGSMVPQGPQEYFVVYEFIYDELIVTYPNGAEKLVPNTTERLRWESQGDSNISSSFDIAYSLDNGLNWTTIANGLSSDSRYYDWMVPDTFSQQALIRVERGAISASTDTSFSILGQVQNLHLVWTCADSSLIAWDAMPNVDGYILYKLGNTYMDSIQFLSTNQAIVSNLSLTESEYLAVASVRQGVVGRRSMAIERDFNAINCTPFDLGILSILQPAAFVMPDCATGSTLSLEIAVRNWGTSVLNYIPIGYRLNGGAVVLDTVFTTVASGNQLALSFSSPLVLTTGNHFLEVWTHFANDANWGNDTLRENLIIYGGANATLPLVQSFDGFAACNTAWGCASISCSLSDGWYNVMNTQGDSIDWRTDANGTGSGGTGPSADHTSGFGNYLYLEGSGNNGAGCQHKLAVLHSPCIDLTNALQPELYFWYHANGGSIGSLHVDVISDGILYENVLPFVDGPQGNQWDSLGLDLSPYVGGFVSLVFRGYTGGGYQSDLAIDDIYIVDNAITAVAATASSLDAILKLYPNPASKQLHIEMNDVQSHQERSIRIYDMQGRLLDVRALDPLTTATTVDVSSYNQGAYMIVVSDRNGVLGSSKFIKE